MVAGPLASFLKPSMLDVVDPSPKLLHNLQGNVPKVLPSAL
jgi:hypothetical protein